VKSDAFRAAVEAKDFSTFEEIFSDDPTFVSPAVFKPYEGAEAMRAVLTAAIKTFEGLTYIDQVETGNRAALIFEADVGDKQVKGVDILTFDDEDRVTELMVMIRPLRGLEAVVERMAENLGVPTRH
jgi:hypothetical protein